MNRQIFGKGKGTIGVTPAVALINPKYSRNVSQVVRACSCFGFKQCWFTGDRVEMELAEKKRIPREERMKGYNKVDIIQYDYFFEQFKDATPVGIELIEGAEIMTEFEHPENPLYVFGPEDGSLTKMIKGFCHRFVFIPTKHCLNLAASVHVTLYDRYLKRAWNGQEKDMTTDDVLEESRGWTGFEDKFYGNSDSNFSNVPIGEMLKNG